MSLKRNIQVLAALAAVFAFSAIAASSALAANDAPRWTINGATPTSGNTGFHGVSTGSENAAMEQAKEVGKLEVTGLFTLTNPKGACTVTGNIAGSVVDVSGTVNNVVLICHEVHMENNPHCLVESEPLNKPGTVQTTTLSGITEWLAKNPDPSHKTGVTFMPAGTEPFARLTITDDGTKLCFFTGLTTNVTGSIVGEVEKPGTDAVTQSLNFPTPPITTTWNNKTPREETATKDGLFVGGKAAQFTNTFDITLNKANPEEPALSWGVETG